MNFEWDLSKGKANLLRHGIDSADAVTAFDDEHGLTVRDLDSETEERYLTVARDAIGRVLVTCLAYRAESIRIISSRKASPGERRRYQVTR